MIINAIPTPRIVNWEKFKLIIALGSRLNPIPKNRVLVPINKSERKSNFTASLFQICNILRYTVSAKIWNVVPKKNVIETAKASNVRFPRIPNKLNKFIVRAKMKKEIIGISRERGGLIETNDS